MCLILRDKVLNDFNFISLDESIYSQHENDINCEISSIQQIQTKITRLLFVISMNIMI